MKSKINSSTCVCGSKSFVNAFIYDSPPKGEIIFRFSSSNKYHREILKCKVCGHYISVHSMNDNHLYDEDYVSSTYGDKGIKKTFDKITSLDPSKSDNTGRVNRVKLFADSFFLATQYHPSILDVGSGLCVFLYRMKAAGWQCTALDPDKRSVDHAIKNAGVNAIHADFLKIKEDIGKFDVISFNKVLEHVPDPIAMLQKAKKYLKPKGFIYIELPDGEMASKEGKGREEFFIDHLHIFSTASLALLVQRAGFSIHTIERLKEPSTKYTLRAFLVNH